MTINEDACKRYGRTVKPVLSSLWMKPLTNNFQELVFIVLFLLQLHRLQMTAVCWTDEVCKENTSEDPFSAFESPPRNTRKGQKWVSVTARTIEIDVTKYRTPPPVKITEVYVEYTLKSSTTRALPSVWRFWMCAEDEPITLKEKACRSVCSLRQWIMIERWNPLSAVTQVTSKVKKFRDKTLKTNRVGGIPDRIGIVWVGDLPEERRIWLSHIEDDGERSMEQNLRIKIFEARKRKLLHTTGSVPEVDSCSFRHDINKRAKMTQPNPSPNFFMQQDEKDPKSERKNVPVEECVDGHARITSKECASTHSEKWHPPDYLFYRTQKWRQTWGKVLSCASSVWWTTFWKGPRGIFSSHVEEEWFARKRMATCCQLWQVTSDRGDPISIVTPVMSWSEDLFNADHRTHGIWVVFQDMKPPKSILRKSSDMKKPIQRVKITKAIARRTKIRDQNSSLGYSEVFKNWMKRSGSRKFILLEHKIIYFFMNSYWSRDLREAHHKSQWNGRIDDISVSFLHSTPLQEEFVEDQDAILELTGKIQDLLNEMNCMNDSRNFQDWRMLATRRKPLRCCWIRMYWFLRADHRLKQNHKDEFLPDQPQILTCWGENLDRHSTTRLFPPTDYSLSTKLIILLCHGCLPREDDGSFELLRIEWQSSETCPASVIVGLTKSDEQNGRRRTKRKFQCCPDSSGKTLYFRDLQRHFGRNLMNHSSQSLFWTVSFEFFNHVGYAINLHSHHQFKVDTKTSNFEQQTDSILSVCGSFGQRTQASWHDRVGSTAPCTSMRKAWKRHQNPMYWATSTLLWRKDWSIRHNRTPSSSTKHFQLIVSRSCSDGNLRSRKRKSFCVTSSSSKDFFATWLDEIIGFRSCSTNRWTSCSTIHKNTTKPTKLNPKSW